MALNNCSCGREVRLSAIRVTVNRHRGVAHAIVHMGDSSKPCVDGDWFCAMMKPYPKKVDQPATIMMEYWQAVTDGNTELPK